MPHIRPLCAVVMSAFILSACGGGGDGDPGSGIVSGQIEIESRTRVDSDSADDKFYGEAVSNDDAPQSLPSPVLAGGYLSVGGGTYVPEDPRTPVTDFFQDQIDRFQLSLTADQVVSVQAFEVNGADYAGTPSAEVSLGSGNARALSPGSPVSLSPDVGDDVYDLVLRAISGGPMRYVISVSSPSSGTALSLTYPETDFVPNEALVIMASPSPINDLKAGPMAAATKQRTGNGIWRVRRGRPAIQQATNKIDAQKATLEWIRSLRKEPGVVSVEPNYRYHALAVNASYNDLYPLQQWHYQAINLPSAWQALSNPGAGVRIAVLDTGIFSRTPATGGNWHPDLDDGSATGNNLLILNPSDFVTEEDDSQSGPDGNPSNPGTDGSTPASFHGTHVAGTIAALDNDIGGVGVAPLATILPIRVLDSTGSGSSLELINAIDYLADLPQSQRPSIINLSLGGVAPSAALESVINKAYQRGILIVAAAGNQGTSERIYPAAFDRVIAVGAVDAGNRRASYSSFGDWIDLVAPGGDSTRDGNSDGQADAVFSAWGQQSGSSFEPAYAGVTGTSMAAPHVAGVLALMRERSSSLTLEQFREFMRQGQVTDVIGNRTEYGYGLINALKAVDAASGGTLGTFVSASPGAFQFDGSVTQASVLLEVIPEGSAENPLAMPNPSGVPPWLTIDWQSEGDGLRLNASINDVQAARQASIEIEYSNEYGSQTLALPVNVQLGDPEASRDAGRHYVLLIDQNDPDAEILQTVVEASNGRYSFAIDDVPNGEYLLVAGTDTDNNGIICEPGEACAEYPSNGLPQAIVKGKAGLTGLTLTTSFRRPALSMESLPRVGFDGYQLNGRADDVNTKRVTR